MTATSTTITPTTATTTAATAATAATGTTGATSFPAALPASVATFLDSAVTTEYASLTASGRPVTWPVTPYTGEDGTTLDVSTGLTYPSKAERARRDPRVALLFSDPLGSGVADAPVVLVQGLATVRDADLQAGLDRYLKASRAKLPAASAGIPWFLLRRSAWYYARIWVAVTPLRVTWWEGSRLDVVPQVWTAPDGVPVPPSDPAAPGPATAPWRAAPGDWVAAADRAASFGAPVLSVRGPDGGPLPLPTRDTERVDDGFVVRLPEGVPVEDLTGVPACLTFHRHDDPFTGQENVVLVGRARRLDDGRVHVAVERALGDWSLPGGAVRRGLAFAGAGRALSRRLAEEAARRGQPVPVVRRPPE